jgi:selenocysteine-specific elongation factor
VVSLYLAARFAPPTPLEASRFLGAPPDAIEAMLALAIERDVVVRVTSDLLFHSDAVAEARSLIAGTEDGVTPSQFRDLTHSTRKFAVPLLEYLHRSGLTERRGDRHVAAAPRVGAFAAARRSDP